MASYQFLNRETRAPIGLIEVDEEMCKKLGHEVDKENFCMEYNLVVQTGFGILLKEGGFEVTGEGLDRLIERLAAEADAACKEDDEEYFAFLRWALVENWIFNGWR